ncbi:MAG: hypothetical protein LBH69_00750 [Methanomassiliicoccaceae archaeon]|jgi:hypothetical protein|nr:hypothetical protein [Methanomassiliicoccaceae archaeon]
MKQKYQVLAEEYIDHADHLVPITNEDVCDYVAAVTGKPQEAVRMAVNMAMSRLEKMRTDLFRFRNGVYYRSKETVFGYSPLNPSLVIQKKYITDGEDVIGYETGPSLLNKAGLTTLVPAYCSVATNKYKGRGSVRDEPIKTIVTKPITEVTKENYLYLQTLELIALLNRKRTSIQADDPYGIIYEHIKRLGLDAEVLLYYAGVCGGGKLADGLTRVYHRGARNETA